MDNETLKDNFVAVMIPFPNDWVTQVYKSRIYKEWLKEKNIEYLEIGSQPYDYPSAILMSAEDAIAFKLKFGL